MTPQQIWSELGLEPGADRTAVRRAYAQRLKVTHPEDDPEAFKRLRAAYEMALVWVERGVLVDADAAQEGSPASEAAPPPQAAAASPSEGPGAPDPLQEHWEACRTLIARATSGEGSEEELLAALDTILRSPILDHLEVYQHTGLGLARSLLEISPKGDVMVWPVLTRFGWQKSQDSWGVPGEVAALRELGRRVTDRNQVRDIRAQVRDTRAYRLLTAPPPKRGGRETRFEKEAVMRLIRASQADESWVRSELREDSVRWWTRYADPKRALRRRQLIFLGGVAGFIAVIALLSTGVEQVERNTPIDMLTPEQIALRADREPQNPAVWASLCRVTSKNWWRESSLNDCDHAATLNPYILQTQLDRAYLYIKVGDYDHAEKMFDKVLLYWAASPAALYGRALARGGQDKLKEGRDDWCKAQELDPDVKGKIEAAWDFRVDGAYEPCKDDPKA
ncbi:hypothetical protein [Phenylobacterium sp.]|uniref:J domain-containing protein n=1 Tax=Phenylobacterium sp. TaxID=1871053 RepID=UPI003D28675B